MQWCCECFVPIAALFSVMCYNVLCDKYATRQLYGYCPSWALNWEYRKKSIMQEILSCSADIISLQVWRTQFIYAKCLLGYDGFNGLHFLSNIPILWFLLWLFAAVFCCIKMFQKHDWVQRWLDYGFVLGSGDGAVLQLFSGGAQRARIWGLLQPQISCQDHVRVWPQTRGRLCHLL